MVSYGQARLKTEEMFLNAAYECAIAENLNDPLEVTWTELYRIYAICSSEVEKFKCRIVHALMLNWFFLNDGIRQKVELLWGFEITHMFVFIYAYTLVRYRLVFMAIFVFHSC